MSVADPAGTVTIPLGVVRRSNLLAVTNESEVKA